MVKKQLLGLWLLVAFAVNSVMAKEYAYVYIEGDKQTPFYVKLEGQMMPRLGKNYCILSNMDAGVTNIEILFQQNQFPSQKFVIKVPEGGYRGFLLKKVNERQYALYDMQQGFYLVSGNAAADDRFDPAAQAAAQQPVISGTSMVVGKSAGAGDIPAFVPAGTGTEKSSKNKKSKETVASQPAAAPAASSEDSKFIKDIELNTGDGGAATVAAGAPVVAAPVVVPSQPKKSKKAKEDNTATSSHIAAADADEFDDDKKPEETALVAPGIPNSDCKNPMTNEVFEDFATKILDQTTDDDKLKVLSRSKNKDCFSTEQVRIIANNFETQSGRYEVVKMLFPRTSDQDNYPKLEALFKTNYLKDKFRQIMSPK